MLASSSNERFIGPFKAGLSGQVSSKGIAMRRFHLQTIKHAKNVAKALKSDLSASDHHLKLSACQQIVAQVFGYSSWFELEKAVGSDANGPYDDELSAVEVEERRTAGILAIRGQGVDKATAMVVMSLTSPTARPGHVLEPLEWTPTNDGHLMGKRDHEFFYIVKGRETPPEPGESFSILMSFDEQFPLLPRMAGEGYSAVEAGYRGEMGNRTLLHEPTIELTKAAIERLRHRDLLLSRGDPSFDDEWPAVGSKKVIADGLVLEWGRYDEELIYVSPDRLRKMAPALRPAAIGTRGLTYERHGEGSFVVLSFPEYFSAREILRAKDQVKRQFPAAYNAILLGEAATEVDIQRAGRGIRRTRVAWTISATLEINADGSRLVLATPMSSYGPASDEQDASFFQTKHLFKIHAENVEAIYGDPNEPDWLKFLSFEAEDNEYVSPATNIVFDPIKIDLPETDFPIP
jgi:hypothetical protein